MIDTKFSKKKKSLCFFTHFFPSLSFPCVSVTVSNARARETHTPILQKCFCLALQTTTTTRWPSFFQTKSDVINDDDDKEEEEDKINGGPSDDDDDAHNDTTIYERRRRKRKRSTSSSSSSSSSSASQIFGVHDIARENGLESLVWDPTVVVETQ